MTRRIEQLLEPADHIEALFRKEMTDQLHLLHSHTMLTRNGAACGDTVFENILAGSLRPFQLARLAGIEENDGMQISIAGMENIADGEIVAFRDFVDVT